MADKDHLAILRQGVTVWNKWRKANPDVKPDLSGADLTNADLKGADLYFANLRDAILSGAVLRNANLRDADLYFADLYFANLSGAILRGTILSEVDLIGAVLEGADTSHANLTGANLTNADLTRVHALGTNFKGATLTGALIEDWNINVGTNLNDVVCDYVYLKWDWRKQELQERRPSDPNKNFAPGEFTALFQKALETVDLIFADGIDWRAFFQSFQELQSQYADQELSIQAIEKKPGGAFVIRLETLAVDVDKAAIESAAMDKYQAQLQLLESRYEERLQLQGEQLEFYRQQVADYRHQNTDLIELAKLAASRPINVEATAMSNSQSSGDTYNGNIKAGNFAPHGTASGGTFNDYSQTITNNLDEIGQLISTLRSQAEQFPPDEREAVDVHLGELEEASNQPQKQDPKRIKAKLMALLAIAVGLGGAIATATDFTNNVLELGKKFDIELVQPQGTPSVPSPQAPHPQGTQTVDVKRLEGGTP